MHIEYSGKDTMKQLIMILIIMQFTLGQQIQEGVPYSQIYGLENNYHTIEQILGLS